MIKIIKGTREHCEILSRISEQTFWESHGISASKDDIESFINKTYSEEAYVKELDDSKNKYFLIYQHGKLAGYSKLVFNSPNPNISHQNVTKLDRLYLLKEFYGLNLGVELLNFNTQLSRENHQIGMWLAVWIGNKRAVSFYTKMRFDIVGSYDFEISNAHSNPNHIMYLQL
jgi:GNAT superfamily N-acetyltransferase